VKLLLRGFADWHAGASIAVKDEPRAGAGRRALRSRFGEEGHGDANISEAL